jgi:hypothetical protein
MQVIESTGAKLIKLPYSPDSNKLEHLWANLKAALKKAASVLIFVSTLLLKFKLWGILIGFSYSSAEPDAGS